ncbi:alpha/beta-hydrolase [Acephala macrosclerotiorum]|nr:alpha/beta-hydrolase [Acephala macrosclerotiorum]
MVRTENGKLSPTQINTATFSHEGTSLWYQKYNTAASGNPIVMIHGGLEYSAYFGSVISQTHQVIAVDRRGHGRSTYNANDVFTFDMFASDTYALLQAEGVTEAVFVGWSDGAATTLAALVNSTIDAMVIKVFVFAGFQSVSDSNITFTDTTIYSTFRPWSDEELGKIDGSKVMIAGADHDEVVNSAVPAHLNSVIIGSQLVKLTNVSHFAPVQDPVRFAAAVEAFL